MQVSLNPKTTSNNFFNKKNYMFGGQTRIVKENHKACHFQLLEEEGN
jgi:hypothetical protein